MALTRIGLFGGSFNPPHRAHRALAERAIEELKLDRLVVVPAGRPWQKLGTDLVEGAHRLALTRLAMQGLPKLEVSAVEVERDEPSTSIATLSRLQDLHPGAEWFLVIGQDQYARMSGWKSVPDLLARCTLAVTARAGQAVQADPALPTHRMQVLHLPADAVNATEIRAALSRGADVTPMVGPEVAGYIAQHHLYGA